MNITLGELKQMIREALLEANCTAAGGATFQAGEGGVYGTPKAFKKVSRPKRPSHTKMFDFLEEN